MKSNVRKSMKKLQIVLCLVLTLVMSVTTAMVSVSAGEEDYGSHTHADPRTFQKNFCLTVDQKTTTIQEIESVVSKILKPEMSDMEKYYKLAVWLNKRVKYDSDFWSGGYNFDVYSHQWDAYGVLKEKSVCVGIAITYANLCHAADLPCKFVRTYPEYVDHTINYIPDINGNAYYVDVTENCYLMSEDSCPFADDVDKEFANITKDCTDGTFDFWEDGTLQTANLKEFYNLSYEDWFDEYALHKYTYKDFRTKYVEKGSGKAGTHYASYHDYESQYSAKPDIWFMEDFYMDPEAVKEKIYNREFDDQLVSITRLKDHYESEDPESLTMEVEGDIVARYFPSLEDGEIVAWEDSLKADVDFTVGYEDYDYENGEAILTMQAEGDYEGSCEFRVKWSPKKNIENVRVVPGELDQYTWGEIEPSVFYMGMMLEDGIDYTWEKVNPDDDFSKPGDYEIELTGKGDYVGQATKVFHIVVEEEEAEAMLEVAKQELAKAQAAVAALDDDATSAEITASLRQLVVAQQSWQNAWETLNKTRSVLSEENIKELSEQVESLQEQLQETSDELDEQMKYIYEEILGMMTIDITRYPFTICLDKESYTYTGKAIEPKVTVPGLDEEYYTVSYSDNVNVGTATVTVKTNGVEYKGTITKTFQIVKEETPKVTLKENTLNVKGLTATVKYKKIKNKAKTLGVTKVINFINKGQGTITYAKSSGNKKITVNKKTGKITIKKGLKKGTYKVKVKVQALGNNLYKKSKVKTVTVRIRVK